MRATVVVNPIHSIREISVIDREGLTTADYEGSPRAVRRHDARIYERARMGVQHTRIDAEALARLPAVEYELAHRLNPKPR
jgi:hypothetical protein